MCQDLDSELEIALEGKALKAFASEYGPDELKSLISDGALAGAK